MQHMLFITQSAIRKKGPKKPFVCQMALGYSRAQFLTDSLGCNHRKKQQMTNGSCGKGWQLGSGRVGKHQVHAGTSASSAYHTFGE